MEIFIAIWSDSHADTEVYPFSTAEKAIAFAKRMVRESNRYPEDLEEKEGPQLTAGMRKAGWLYSGVYSCESDGITVVKAELDKDASEENSQ